MFHNFEKNGKLSLCPILKQGRSILKHAFFVFNISALAGILLKSENVYLFFFQYNFSDDLNNSDILFGSECKRESCRRQFNSSAMERASGNYPFVC